MLHANSTPLYRKIKDLIVASSELGGNVCVLLEEAIITCIVSQTSRYGSVVFFFLYLVNAR